MRKIIVFTLLILLAFAEIHEEDDVLVLNDQNFDEALGKYEKILIEFYAPWCGHCKKLTPEYARAAKFLKQGDQPFPLAKCDAAENTKVAERFKIEGFPTLKFFTNGQDQEYNGGRTEKDIIAWVQKRIGAVSVTLKTQAEFDRFIKENQVAVVYFGNSEQDESFGAFKNAAVDYDKLAFANVFDGDLTAALKTQAGKVVLFKQFDDGRSELEGTVTVENLKTFIDQNSFATVMEFDDRAIEKIFQQGHPTIFLFQGPSADSSQARKEFENAAKQLKGGKLLFSVSRPDDGHGHFNRLAEYLGVNVAKAPLLMLVHSTDEEVVKYQFNDEITVSNIESFANNFNAGKLNVYMKTEDIPEKNDEGVRVLVGKNFQDEVINNEKDVLVKFYAPWCGHCKTLAPKWDAAAERLKNNNNIVIAKCDSTANEIKGVDIKGFPTLKFYPGNNKSKPIDFDGDRTEEGIIKWLKEHTTHPWTEEVKEDL